MSEVDALILVLRTLVGIALAVGVLALACTAVLLVCIALTAIVQRLKGA